MTQTQEQITASNAYKSKIANFLVIAVIVIIVILAAGFLSGANWLAWLLFLINIIFGPACLFFYLLEVKRGVFRDDESSETN